MAQPTPVTSPNPGLRVSSARPKKSRTVWYVVIGVVLVVLLAVAAAIKNKSNAPATAVTTDKAETRTITQLVSATGKIQPEKEVKISPEVAGEIIALPLREDNPVKKGDLLVKIKPDYYVYQLEQSQAALASARAAKLEAHSKLLKAEADFHRNEDLFNRKLISDSDFATAKSDFEIAKANDDDMAAQIQRSEGLVKQAQDYLDKCTIFSPIDGTVTARTSEEGERVVAQGQFTGTEVMRVADLTNMEVRANVNENDVVNVKIGDTAQIAIDAYPNRKFKGVVTQIAATAKTQGANTQEEVTNFEVRVRVVDPGVSLRPGMSSNVDIETATVKDVVAVPIQAVTVRSRGENKTIDELKTDRETKVTESKGDNGAAAVSAKQQREAERADRERLQRIVFLVEGDHVKQLPVETGIADTAYMEIKSGLKAGDTVVSGSFSAVTRVLKDGMKIRVEKQPTTPVKKP